jgi:hypothetical protein
MDLLFSKFHPEKYKQYQDACDLFNQKLKSIKELHKDELGDVILGDTYFTLATRELNEKRFCVGLIEGFTDELPKHIVEKCRKAYKEVFSSDCITFTINPG